MASVLEKIRRFLEIFGNIIHIVLAAISLIGLGLFFGLKTSAFLKDEPDNILALGVMVPVFAAIALSFRIYGYKLGKTCHCGIEWTADLCSGIFWIWNLFLWYWLVEYFWVGGCLRVNAPLALSLVFIYLLFLSSLRCPFALFSWLIWVMSPSLMFRCIILLDADQSLLLQGFGVAVILCLIVMWWLGLRLAWRRHAAYSTLCWVTLPLIWRSHMDDFGWTLVPGMSLLILIPALLLDCFWNHSTASVSDTEESKGTDSSSNTVLKRELMNKRRADFLFFTGILLIQAMISIGSYWYRMS